MNKKGFTLIELLAIIAIIAIIGIITVPTILNTIDNSRKKMAIDSVYGYARTLKEYYYNKQLEKTEKDFVGKHYIIGSNGYLSTKDKSFVHNISFTGKNPDSGLIDIGVNGEVSGCIVVSDFRFYIENDEISDDILKGDDCRETYTITFETNGGNSIAPITAKEGSTIVLPTPIKTIDDVSFTFDGWYDSEGEAVSNTMPSDNVTYYAHYEALVAKFDTGFVNKVKSTASNSTNNIYKFLRADSIDSTYKNDTYKVSSDADSDVPIWMWYDSANHIVYWYSLSEHPGFKDTSLYKLFYNAKNLIDINGLADLDVSNITNMSYVFYGTSLSNVDVLANWAQWTSTKKLTNLEHMFSYTTSLDDMNGLANWDVSNVTNISYILDYSAVTNIGALANWNVSNVTNMAWLLSNNKELSDISALSSWNVSNVVNMSYMFYGTTSLSDISALSNWAQWTNTKKLTNISYMFYGLKNLSDISVLTNWNVSNVTNMKSMFMGATSLSDISALSNWAQWTSTKKLTNISYMFREATSLSNVNALSNWDVSNVTDLSNMFFGATSLNDISALSSWNVGNVTTVAYMFYGTAIENVNALSNWAQWTSTQKLRNMSYMFHGATNLNDIGGLANWNTGSVTTMHEMFYEVTNLDDISALSNWNTGSVSDMSYMFYGTTSLDDISALSNWNIKSVTNMSYMFHGTTNLSDISILSNWAQWTSTKKLKNLSYMFREATSLSNVNALSNWDISNVTDLSNMFYGATSLSDVSGLANWNTGSVTNMSYMFYGTTNLTGASSLHWVTKSVAKNSYVQIFYNSGVLTSGNYPTFYSDDAKTQVIGGTWNSSGTFKPSS